MLRRTRRVDPVGFRPNRNAAVALLVGMLLIVCVNVTAAFSVWRSREDSTADWLRFLGSMGELAGQHADQTIAAAEVLLMRVTDRVQRAAPADQEALVRQFGTREVFRELEDFQDDLPQVDVVTIVAASGDVVNFSRGFPTPKINLSDRDYFIEQKKNDDLGLYLSEPVKNRGTGKWTFYLSHKIVDANGRLLGMALVGIEADYLGKFYRTIQLGHEEPVLTLARNDGRVLARYPQDDVIMAKTLHGNAYRMIESRAPTPALVRGPRTTNPEDTRNRLMWSKASKVYPVSLNLTVTETLYLEHWHRSATQIGVGALLVSLLILLATLYIRRLLVRRDDSESDLRAAFVELAEAKRHVLRANEDLEQRVLDRTEMLARVNDSLDSELIERRRVESKLEMLARFDPLTGLPNRSLFMQRLDEAVEKALQTGKLMGLMFVDLDHFKSVNDSYGHEVGDLVLREAGSRMRSLVRHTDVVSRMGGDEFTVVIEDVEDFETFQAIAKKLVKGFAAPFFVDNKEVFLTLSVGVAIASQGSRNASDLMKQADFAMYHAKAEGRNGFQLHSACMEDKSRERTAVEYALRHALERDEFELHYQIRVSAETKQPVGMEALVRWNSPELGFVSPVAFIPVAEDTGLIVPLGTWILRTACKQHAAWQQQGLRPGVMGINVSARQFREPDFGTVAAQIAAECGVRPSSLELEVTESLLMSDPLHAQRQMSELRALGFGIAIDDFGTGFSSLSHLKLFPASKLKIDRAFVQGIDANPQDQAIASAIVALAKTLSMTVTAEGVETAAQLAQLSLIDCDEYQGFLFGKPQTAEVVGSLLRQAGLEIPSLSAAAVAAGSPGPNGEAAIGRQVARSFSRQANAVRRAS